MAETLLGTIERITYYNEENGHKTNSQMVLRYCIPSIRLLELIE